ncbi:hypothetical protein SISNIDRAFT_472210 [Sistotremastrum niveocremeum HHB9708]|uniref:Cytoplasmic protein n=2 Tax=Sistotremastraceae TaxID=3402574 RepID=A0A165AMY5_9AGAM|nr:hypothetical protein SISNIDRAFT_472210 [Sistotremastrum niveocremeum HHB9708]KZT36975.1 hypothetical protein SISSUDRAFT_1071335 [Sistotremastrum suecicum HHB10207 ss-3]
MAEQLTNLAHPKTSATITIRVVKSFEYRTEKSLVLHDLDLLTTSVAQLKQRVLDVIRTQSAWKPYRTAVLDTLKIYTKAHGSKTSNLIINLDNDDWILSDDSAMLADLGLENETEVSFFNKDLYDKFKAHPVTNWE